MWQGDSRNSSPHRTLIQPREAPIAPIASIADRTCTLLSGPLIKTRTMQPFSAQASSTTGGCVTRKDGNSPLKELLARLSTRAAGRLQDSQYDVSWQFLGCLETLCHWSSAPLVWQQWCPALNACSDVNMYFSRPRLTL